MRFVPVLAFAHFDQQRHGELGDIAHQRGQGFTHAGDFRLRRFQHEFVMHLQNHARGELFLLQPVRHRQHRALDEVGCRALHGGVDGGALCRLTAERMKREAPGTMAHSMAVATLSEDAARAIGANALAAKAGALFHDIGKLVMPQYFTENNPDSALQHLNLNPQMSSIIIRDHVKEGLLLARRYRLCREVRDIIATHHGDDLVRYFYNKMLENAKHDGSAPPVLESQFRYSGEPPRGVEATIVSLADACEAASRSLEHPTPERLRELVDRIFLGRFQGGQLRRSLMPLADLEKVRESFIATLSSARHGRVSYDTPAKEEAKDNRSETALPVAQSAPSESPQK